MSGTSSIGWALVLFLSLSCGAGDLAIVPQPEFYRDSSGALFCSFDSDRLNAFLATLELPQPEPLLSVVEGGTGEKLAIALTRIASERSGNAFGELGMFFHKLKRHQLAVQCYLKAGVADPRVPWWPHFRGDLAEDAGDLDLAIQLFGEAAKLAPGAVEPRTRRAMALRVQGRESEMENQIAELLRLDPRSLFALTEFASLALEDGNLDRAQEMLQKALEFWPHQRRVHVLLARAYRAAGRHTDADASRHAAKGALEMTTLFIDPWMARIEAVTNSILFWKTGAQELQQAGRWEELLRVAQELHRREPGLYWKAKQVQALVLLDRLREAIALSTELTTHFSESPVGFEMLSLVQLAERNFDAARASANQAIERDSGSNLAHEILIKSHLGLGEDTRAIRVAEDYQALHPSEVGPLALTLFVHQALGESAIERADWPEAAVRVATVRELLRLAQEIAPGDPLCTSTAEWLVQANSQLRGE